MSVTIGRGLDRLSNLRADLATLGHDSNAPSSSEVASTRGAIRIVINSRNRSVKNPASDRYSANLHSEPSPRPIFEVHRAADERASAAGPLTDFSPITLTIDDFTYIAGSGNLSTPANYAGGTAPGDGQNIAFSNPSGGFVTNTTLSSVNSFTFNSGTGAFTLSGSSLTVNAGITNNGGSAQTIYNNLKVGADQSFNANAGSLSFGGSVDTNGQTLTVTGSNTTTFLGVITGTGNLVKNGSGTAYLIGSYSSNGHTGFTTVSGGTLSAGVGSLIQTSSLTVNTNGTLLLSGSGRHIGANTEVTLAGGTFDTGGYSEPGGIPDGLAGSNHIGALTLTASSTISFGTSNSSVLEFSSVGPHTPGTTLSVTNWDGVIGIGGSGDRLLFGGLETTFLLTYNLNEVSFNGIQGYSTMQFLDGTNSPYFEVLGLVPIPEPSTWLAGLLAASAILFAQRRRLTRTNPLDCCSNRGAIL